MKIPHLFSIKPSMTKGDIFRLAIRFCFLALLLAALVGLIHRAQPGISESAVFQATPSLSPSQASPAIPTVQSSAYPVTNPALVATPVSTVIPTPTINPEWVANRSQTNGILFGAAVLVLIIVGGTLVTIRRKLR